MIARGWSYRVCYAPAILVMALLAGCAGWGERRDAPAEISDRGGEAVDRGPSANAPVPGAPIPDASSADAAGDAPDGNAHGRLLASAQQALARGNSSQAIALLERAQRIDPGNGQLYLELAKAHLEAGNVAQARATAERGLLYCRQGECAALRALIDRSVSAASRS